LRSGGGSEGYVAPTKYLVIWQLSSFTGIGRHRVPLCALF
jgi:hypothetical protein